MRLQHQPRYDAIHPPVEVARSGGPRRAGRGDRAATGGTRDAPPSRCQGATRDYAVSRASAAAGGRAQTRRHPRRAGDSTAWRWPGALTTWRCRGRAAGASRARGASSMPSPAASHPSAVTILRPPDCPASSPEVSQFSSTLAPHSGVPPVPDVVAGGIHARAHDTWSSGSPDDPDLPPVLARSGPTRPR